MGVALDEGPGGQPALEAPDAGPAVGQPLPPVEHAELEDGAGYHEEASWVLARPWQPPRLLPSHAAAT